MAQTNTEGTQASRQQPGRTEAQSAERKPQSAEQQAARQSGGLQRRPAREPFGSTGFAGLSPFSFMRRMLEDMDLMFEGFGGGRLERGAFAAASWLPAIDVLERDGKLLVRADVPGLSPEDVRLEVRDGQLVLEGERKQEREVEGEGVYRSERTHGRFSRVISLPEGADVEQAQARFENGVLEVEVPLRKEAQRRRIEIQGGSKPAVH